jgi:CheY-like chemotaxis protein
MSQERILIIEDNLEGVRGLRSLLTLLGYQVNVAYSATEGIDAAEKLLPEVILCDINLPDLDGWTVAEQLKRNLRTARIRLIAVTSCGTDGDRRRSYQAGFEHHVTKPVDLSLLLKLLPRPDSDLHPQPVRSPMVGNGGSRWNRARPTEHPLPDTAATAGDLLAWYKKPFEEGLRKQRVSRLHGKH